MIYDVVAWVAVGDIVSNVVGDPVEAASEAEALKLALRRIEFAPPAKPDTPPKPRRGVVVLLRPSRREGAAQSATWSLYAADFRLGIDPAPLVPFGGVTFDPSLPGVDPFTLGPREGGANMDPVIDVLPGAAKAALDPMWRPAVEALGYV
jgi:hypothetical protein